MLAATAVALLMFQHNKPTARVDFNYESRQGLMVQVEGVPVVKGSFFQVYDAGWKKGHYSSNWNDQVITRGKDGDIGVVAKSKDGRVGAILVFKKTADGFDAEYKFTWNGASPVFIENTLGVIWAAPFRSKPIVVDGTPIARDPDSLRGIDDKVARRIGPTARSFELTGSFCTAKVTTETEGTELLDGRGWNQEWARDRDNFWLGHEDIAIKPGETVTIRAKWAFSASGELADRPARLITAKVEGQHAVLTPEIASAQKLIPTPKSIKPNGDTLITADTLKVGSSTYQSWFDQEFTKELNRKFGLRRVNPKWVATPIELGIRELNLPAQGYEISIASNRGHIYGQDAAGLRQGLRTLAKLAVPRVGDGLAIPCVTIRDWPTTPWRGAHLFVGDEALEFQTKFMDRVLAPMGFNYLVSQCERTNWKMMGPQKGQNATSREDLKALFDRYQKVGIEPIPMIQSFGHMEWLLDRKQFRDLAFNPSVLYSVDPRKPRTREVLDTLWAEVIDLLKPKTIHFGLDEVDMRGWPEDPTLVTELWNMHLPWLGTIAKKHNVDLMLWGDIALAPSEAPDAANSPDVATAKLRRSSIPKGAWIADWHYKDDPNPDIYRSLKLWNDEGYRPIASTWNRPGNIRGFINAAQKVGAGYLQTTWAGYESTEKGMIRNFPQFAAFILGADIAWSGKTTAPDYDPIERLYEMYFAPPKPVVPVAGFELAWGKPIDAPKFRSTAGMQFSNQVPISLISVIDPALANAPREIVLKANTFANHLAFRINTKTKIEMFQPVADIVVTFADKTTKTLSLRYGEHIRAQDDPTHPYVMPRDTVLMDLGQSRGMTDIRIRATDLTAGVQVKGVVGW